MNNGPRRFRKILIANRGEIACRIIWTCKEMGIGTVAVHSDVDRDSLHVRFADEAACIGPAPSAQSYLNIPAIISAAEIFNVDAIHPGYGFLAESAYFAEICEACNIKFIGPRSDVIQLMGEKVEARRAMQAAGVPIVPGSPEALESETEALAIAREIGFPVIVKASAGGGGRGMRVVRSEDELGKALETASNEAAAAFKNGAVYIERFVERPRHIDIVRNQIRIAEGEPLGFGQDDVLMVGHAIECRINAESPETFAPSPGTITTFNLPGGPGVRVDTYVYPGYRVPPFYDSMIAKVIVHARTRELAIARMRRALEAMVIEGIKTTIPLHLKIMNDPDFQAGNISTRFLEDFLAGKSVKEHLDVTASVALTGASA